MARRGLIVGKFYPLHRGHQYLIETGRARTDHLSVIVCGKPGEAPSGELRASWLREMFPDVNVLLIDDMLDPQDSRIWAENSVRWLGFTPDVVFTSEDYGQQFAYHLGCKHVQVDKARIAIPISGTQVRADPLGCWEYLDLPLRAYYAKRICLVGAESTGKTTLARRLAEQYHTVWVPEYGRDYSERNLKVEAGNIWTSEEFVHIAHVQCEMEDAAAREANRILICDTDAFATSIWHRRYMGVLSQEVEDIAAGHRRPDLYLLSDVAGTEFVQDGTRDGELIREWMHETFLEELLVQERPFRLLTGSWEKRFNQAREAIDGLLRSSQD